MRSATKNRSRRPGTVQARTANRRRGATPRVQAANESPAELTAAPTLEETLLTTWAALLAGHPVECPVCGGPLTVANGCSRCGTRLV